MAIVAWYLAVAYELIRLIAWATAHTDGGGWGQLTG